MGIAKTFLAIGIAIVLAVFVGYAVHVFYEMPDYESNSCYLKYNCEAIFDNCTISSNGTPELPRKSNECFIEMENSAEYKNCTASRDACEEDFIKTSGIYVHSRNSFFILVTLGLVAIIAGILIRLEGIGGGLIGGGILIIIWSLIYTVRYWIQLGKYIKLGALGVVLSVLVFLGYEKLEKENRRKTKKKK